MTICAHPKVSPVKLQKSTGTFQPVLQCTHCGKLVQWCKSENCDVESLPDFDYSIQIQWAEELRRVEQEQRRQSEIQAQTWHMEYEAYLESDEWQMLRMKVLLRDGLICQGCLTQFPPERLFVHHKSYTGHNRGFTPAYDLITVCAECHERIHGLRL